MLDRRRKRAHTDLHHRLPIRQRSLRPTGKTTETSQRLSHSVCNKCSHSSSSRLHGSSRRWSGITEAHLASVTTTLAEVQAHVLRIVSPPAANPFSTGPSPPPPPTPILLGHSLESDLKAMKLCHPYCIDTAVIYHHPRGRPLKPGLAWLTKKWCGREIQTGGDGGHDPREDAQACLQLLQKKLENGPSFGEFMIDFESIFERMSRSPRRAGGPAGSIKTAVIDHGNPGVMHGSKASTCIACKDDDEVLKGLLDVLPSHHFAFGRFMALANLLGCEYPRNTRIERLG